MIKQITRNKLQKITASKNFQKLKSYCFIFLFSILLTNCHRGMQDGPPSYPVDISKIKNAVPKPEPRSAYGNPDTYAVYGKQYHVMNSSKNFRERGIASWYGTKFHGARTSSGEPYDMLTMTAAHRSLPLPTYVKVKNLDNNHEIIVKVNDRGPFKSDRIIDLSYGAALKLGMIPIGTAHVEISAISFDKNNKPVLTPNKPISQQTTRLAASPRQGNLTFIQVAAFKDISSALSLKNRLQHLTKKNITVVHNPKEQKGLYRVQIGPFTEIAERDSLYHRLVAQGFSHTLTLAS
jgi:rare lipoprotein A